MNKKHMICVEGYKAFPGDMRVASKNCLYPPSYICDRDWLYNPNTDCW